MIQFNLNRFGRLACWSLRNDKRYYVKSFLQYLVILTLVFLFLTVATVTVNRHNVNYQACSFITILSFAVMMVAGSSFMFCSMDGKHDMQSLLTLPASNFEKYVMRYATWLVLLPVFFVAFVGADLLQYVVNTLVGREGTALVIQHVADGLAKSYSGTTSSAYITMVLTFGWIHSLYALGATFFRWRKYNWICTSVVLIVLGILLVSFFPGSRISGSIDEDTAKSMIHLSHVVYLILIAFNFWLSYKLFCRQQVIGKFVNL